MQPLKIWRLLTNKLTEANKKIQIEVNQLLEKLESSDNNKVQDIVVANYNKLRESYQVICFYLRFRTKSQKK